MTRTTTPFTILNTEWDTIATALWTRRHVRIWRNTDPRFGGHRTIADIVDTIQTGELNHSQQLCWALLDQPHELAARTLLQVLLPGLMGEMRRWMKDAALSPSTSLDHHNGDGEHLLITAASQAIAENANTTHPYPLNRMLSRIHRLALATIRADRKWNDHNEPTDPTTDLPHPTANAPSGEDLGSILTTSVQAGELTNPDAALIYLTRTIGYTPTELAPSYGVTPDTLRRRRHRAETRLINTYPKAS